jgi:hypothetical protein
MFDIPHTINGTQRGLRRLAFRRRVENLIHQLRTTAGSTTSTALALP